MRLLVLAMSLLALAVLVPAAQAQMSSPLVQARIQVDSEPIAAPNSTVLRLTLLRMCPNAATVYDPQVAEVEIHTNDRANWTVTGPLQGMFPQQVCAQQMEQPIEILYQIGAAAGAAGDDVKAHPFVIKARLGYASPTTPAGPESLYPFTLTTQARPAPPPVVEEPERESPGLGLIGAVAALAAVALAARRR